MHGMHRMRNEAHFIHSVSSVHSVVKSASMGFHLVGVVKASSNTNHCSACFSKNGIRLPTHACAKSISRGLRDVTWSGSSKMIW